ncbi:MAG: small multi-drug export protein [Maribacter sp.]|nr:small multi-drug export protein [Maribacter sp.]
MILDLLLAILWSISPFGEAKVGIPYGILNGLNSYVVFFSCFLANLMVFPIMMFFLERINKYLMPWRFYKKSAIFVAKRAKKGSSRSIQRFGFLGLMVFVMLPIPGTGVYAGSIAAYVLKIEKQKAFLANAIGIFFSSLIILTATLLSMKQV